MNKILASVAYLIFMVMMKAGCSPCAVFKCGTIQQKDGKPQICVDSGSNAEYKIGKGSNSTHCQADSWNMPEEISTSVGVKPTDDTPADNSTAPGDVCTKTVKCFGLDSEKDCINGKCITTRKLGQTCEDIQGGIGHKWCPMGAYCKDKVCTQQKAENQTCEKPQEGKFGLNCIALGPDFDNYTCTALHKLPNGSKFAKDRIQYNGKWTGYNSMCQSYHSIEVDLSTAECRAGDRNKEQTREALKKNGNGEPGQFISFSGNFPILGETVSKESKCGFNNITNGFCSKRKGDDWFVEAHKTYMSLDLTKLSGSAGSNVDEKGYDIVNIDPKIRETFIKALLEVDEEYGYHLIANNDACVAKSITAKFWMGTHPDDDSAFYYSSVSLISIAVIFLAIFS